MEVIELARELGQAIAEDERCKRLQAAKAANDADDALQELIYAFNMKQIQVSREMHKDPAQQDKEKLEQLQQELKASYAGVMATPGMVSFTAAKKEMDELIGHINSIIQLSVSGEVDESAACGGNCASCAGCH